MPYRPTRKPETPGLSPATCGVRAWCAAHGIAWHERRQTGVIRRLASRDGWARRWDRQMRHEPIPVPRRVMPVMGIDPGDFILPALAADHCPGRQPGGRAAGVATLRSFLAERGRPYRRSMSSPPRGSRPLFATVAASGLGHPVATRGIAGGRDAPAQRWRPRSLASGGAHLTSFTGRLRWHCHFIQKLGASPRSSSAASTAPTKACVTSTRSGWRPGPRAAPAGRSSTPACACSGPRAG